MSVFSRWMAAAVFLLFPLTVQAKVFEAVGIDAGVNTVGIGTEVYGKIDDNWVVRGGPRYFTMDRSDTIDDVDYDADLEMANLGAMVDWHPFATGFRLTGGTYVGRNELSLTGQPNAAVNIGGTSYSPAQLGRLDGSVELPVVQPYFGIGYSNMFSESSNWTVNVEAGVKFSGSPDVSLVASGPIALDPTFQQNLAQERQEVEDDLEWLQYYPVVGVSVGYSF